MKKVLLYLALPMLMGMTFVACEDDEKVDKDLEQGAAISSEASQVDALTNTVSDLVNDLSQNAENSLKSATVGYPVVTITPFSGTSFYPASVKVDYGPTPIEVTIDGNKTAMISGSVNFTKSKPFYVAGSQQVATFASFTINDYSVVGTITWLTKGQVGAGATWVFNRITGLAITTPEDVVHHQTSEYDFGFIGGWGDGVDGNEVLQITGSVTGDIDGGNEYTHTVDVTNPVVIEAGCQWAVEGTIEVTNESGNFILDLGEGTCDNIATIQRADGTGDVYTIKME